MTKHRLLPRLAVAALSAALAGCAAATPARLGPDSDPRAARGLLAEAAAAGPVRLEVNRLPAGLPRAAAEEAAAEGVRGLDVRFAAPPAGGADRLLLLFDPSPGLTGAEACSASALPPPAGPAGLRLLAAFCDGGRHVADATGEAAGSGPAEARRLVWRTTGRLFPDDYADTYGFNLFGLRVGLSGAFGF